MYLVDQRYYFSFYYKFVKSAPHFLGRRPSCMFIDIHCHILHGVDDGARSLADSIHMAEEAARLGIQKIIATPHHSVHTYHNPRELILNSVSELNEELTRQQLDVEILPGQELRLTPKYVQQHRDHEWQTLGDSPYLLVELPSSGLPTYFWDFVQFVHKHNQRIIIAHPERNHSIMTNKELAHLLIQKGILLQVNASSLLGQYGQKIKRCAIHLCKQRSIHVVASDAHGTYDRGFTLLSGYNVIERIMGEEYTIQLARHARHIAEGHEIDSTQHSRLVHSAQS